MGNKGWIDLVATLDKTQTTWKECAAALAKRRCSYAENTHPKPCNPEKRKKKGKSGIAPHPVAKITKSMDRIHYWAKLYCWSQQDECRNEWQEMPEDPARSITPCECMKKAMDNYVGFFNRVKKQDPEQPEKKGRDYRNQRKNTLKMINWVLLPKLNVKHECNLAIDTKLNPSGKFKKFKDA